MSAHWLVSSSSAFIAEMETPPNFEKVDISQNEEETYTICIGCSVLETVK
jgi:hypothetical protein